jgi:flagellar hook-associated protein 2
LSDLEKFKVFSASSSDEDVFTASASSSAATGTFSIQVERIAENHRMAAATVFTDTNTTKIGVAGDTLTITVGSSAFTVDIGDKTLDEIRIAINAASENSGVTASTLQDDNGFHLTLSADDTGSSTALTVAYSGVDPFSMQTLNSDRDAIPGFTAADLDAVLTIENSFTVTRSSNTIGDVINGVTLNVKTAGQSTLTVSRDTASVSAAAKKFVNAFNTVVSLLDELRGGVLRTDSGSLRNIDAQFRNILSSSAATDSTFSLLAQIGISTERDGTLSLNSTVFNDALSADFDGVADLFADPANGFAARLENLAKGLLETGGIFDGREESINREIRRIENRRASLEFRLEQKEAGLIKQFTALDTLIAQLQTTSSFLSVQLDQIARIGQFNRRT